METEWITEIRIIIMIKSNINHVEYVELNHKVLIIKIYSKNSLLRISILEIGGTKL